MRAKPSRFNRAALSPAGLLLFTLAAPAGCGQEPVILIDIAAWPEGVESIRVRPTFNGTVNADIYINQAQSRFAVRVPAGSAGTVHLDAVGLDAVDCKLAAGSLTEPVPDNLSRFAEGTLELPLLPAPICIFAAATNVPVGTNVSSVAVAVGDFNGDMKPDLAVANTNSHDVSVLLGNGTGSFAATANIPISTNMSSVAVGDFNGDLKLDLAVDNGNTPTVSVVLGNGRGGFASATSFPTGNTPSSVAVGDFNGDMKPDLAVANYESNTVSVLLGNGLGGFGAATNFPVGVNPSWVTVGDVKNKHKVCLHKRTAPPINLLARRLPDGLPETPRLAYCRSFFLPFC